MRRILIALLEFMVMLGTFMVCEKPGTIKYIIVAGISLGVMILGKKKKRAIEPLFCIALPVIVYLAIGCAGSLVNANIYSETIKIMLFWILPLMFAFSLYVFYGENMIHVVDIQFIACALAYLVTKARFIIESHNSESMFAYAYGAFFVYYVYKKRWGFCAFALLLMWLADKRIVLAAAFVAILVQGLLWLFRNDKRVAQGIWGMTTIVCNIYLWLIYSGILEGFCNGVGINTNGRVKMYVRAAEWFDGAFFSIGRGIGIVEKLLSAWNVEKFSNLHNDLLKFHIELGIIGLLIYFACFGIIFLYIEKKFGNKQMCLFVSMSIYTLVLFATDNVSIYIIFLIPLYSIYFAVLSDNEEEVIKKYDK